MQGGQVVDVEVLELVLLVDELLEELVVVVDDVLLVDELLEELVELEVVVVVLVVEVVWVVVVLVVVVLVVVWQSVALTSHGAKQNTAG